MSVAEERIPQIFLVIELAQPRKNEDGSVSPAEIESVRSNLPARYVDVRIVHAIDRVDENGVYIGGETSYVEGDDHYEYLAKYPFTVYDALEGQYVTTEPGKPQEWVVHYHEGDDHDYCLVLGTPDITVAIERFKQTHPKASIWSVQQAELDQENEHPQAYLEEYREILVVGGAQINRISKES